MLNKAKTKVNALASTRIFNAIQDKMCRLQPSNEFSNNLYKKTLDNPLVERSFI